MNVLSKEKSEHQPSFPLFDEKFVVGTYIFPHPRFSHPVITTNEQSDEIGDNSSEKRGTTHSLTRPLKPFPSRSRLTTLALT